MASKISTRSYRQTDPGALLIWIFWTRHFVSLQDTQAAQAAALERGGNEALRDCILRGLRAGGQGPKARDPVYVVLEGN